MKINVDMIWYFSYSDFRNRCGFLIIAQKKTEITKDIYGSERLRVDINIFKSGLWDSMKKMNANVV